MPGIVWPGVPHPAGATMLAMLYQLEHSQWWSPEAMRVHQFAQLRRLARYALEHTSFYRDALDRAEPRDLNDLNPATYLHWPILRRSDIQKRFEDLVARKLPPEHGGVFEIRTSGSTGTPLRVLSTRVAQFFEHAFVLRDHLWQRRDFGRKFGAIRLFVDPGTQAMWSPAINAVFMTGPASVQDTALDVGDQLDWLLEQRPAYLLTTPSNLAALLDLSKATGRKPRELLQVLTYAEALHEELREEVRDAWGVPLNDTYSCREFGTIALQCPEGTHYHVQSENLYVEILREDGNPCAPGETGRVVITALHNFAMPFLRYEIGDFAEVAEPCSCGRGLPTLKRIVGRVTNMAVDPTGRRFWPGIRASLLTARAPVRQIRLVQHEPHRMELRYVMERELTATERESATQGLAEMLGYPYEVEFTRVERLDRGPGGKYEDFVSLLDRA